MQTCTAPTYPTCGHDPLAEQRACNTRLFSYRGADVDALTYAPALTTCQGTEWPPPTSWQRYAQDRAGGERIPPSVLASSWREQDRRRQAAAERSIREQAPTGEPRAVPWGPGPACDDRKAVG
jgi:hypothetical protein